MEQCPVFMKLHCLTKSVIMKKTEEWVFMRRLKKVLAALLAVLIISKSGGVSFTSQAAEPLHILALGDSIAQGYGLENPEKQSYSGVLADKIGAVVSNEGINGLKSADLIEKLQKGEYDAAIQKADVILLSIGSNDILKPCMRTIAKSFGIETEDSGMYEAMQEKFQGQDVDILDLMGEIRAAKNDLKENPRILAACDDFKINFREILSHIHRVNPYVVIYVDNIYNPYYFVDYSYGFMKILDLGELTEPYVRRLNETFQRESQDYVRINTYLLFQKEGYTNVVPASLKEISRVNLDPHPNARGHRAIADLIYEEMDIIPPVLSVETEQNHLVISSNEKIRMVKGKGLKIQAKGETYHYTMSGKEEAVWQDDESWRIEIPLEEIFHETPKHGIRYSVSMEADAVKDMGNNSAEQENLGSIWIFHEVPGLLILELIALIALFFGIFLIRKKRRN